MMDRRKAKGAIQLNSLIVIAPGIQGDGLAASRLMPAEGSQSQETLQPLSAMFRQNASPIDMTIGSDSWHAALGLLNSHTNADRFIVRGKGQQNAGRIEALQPEHWLFIGPRPVMSPPIAITLHGFRHG